MTTLATNARPGWPVLYTPVESPAATAASSRNPWLWVPSLYFAQGIPYVIVMTVAVIMFKRLGVSNKDIAFYTSVLYLPWVIKPLWSPLVQRIGTRRGWVIVMQLLVAAGLACAALSIPASSFLTWSLWALAFVAIASATHDIAADGFYLLALNGHQQAWFVGIRSTFYRLAMIAGQGLLVMLAGFLEYSTGLPRTEVVVEAAEAELQPLQFDPSSMPPTESTRLQRVLLQQRDVSISLRDRSADEVRAIVDAVRVWNVDHGFYAAPEKEAAAEKADWAWKRSLEDGIRRNFGPQRTEADMPELAGDVAIIYFRMANEVPAGQQQVVQFGWASGDQSFKVLEGERFVVTGANWSEPFAAVVQVESKLDEPSRAVFEVRSGNLVWAWSATFFIVAASFLMICAYHYFALPKPSADVVVAAPSSATALSGFVEPIVSFFRKPHIAAVLAFLLLYRLPEAQLVKLATPFLLDARSKGGLALTTGEVGFVYGTIGVAMLTLGGILGGIAAARHGLKRWLWPMALIIHLPNAAFLYLAYAQPESLWLITAAVGVEQFGYGFGFTAYMLYCIYVARGEHQTVHYALCTGCMALGMMIPGMWSGWLQQLIGYEHFFVWVMLCTLVSFATVAFIPLDAAFGKKSE
jgi:MFS transporter, PAT family, beta-lactamase induction signal transducer AmpG